jgi:hypothetical protein
MPQQQEQKNIPKIMQFINPSIIFLKKSTAGGNHD